LCIGPVAFVTAGKSAVLEFEMLEFEMPEKNRASMKSMVQTNLHAC